MTYNGDFLKNIYLKTTAAGAALMVFRGRALLSTAHHIQVNSSNLLQVSWGGVALKSHDRAAWSSSVSEPELWWLAEASEHQASK